MQIDKVYIMSQVFATISLIITLISYHLKTKKKIFTGMCISNIFDIVHYTLLNAYGGLATKVVALFRNIFIIKKEKNKKLDKTVYLLMFIAIYIVLCIITYKDVISLLPYLATVIYLLFVWGGNELQIKKVAFLCYIFWILYNICIFSVMGTIANIIGMISAYIAYTNFKKEKK